MLHKYWKRGRYYFISLIFPRLIFSCRLGSLDHCTAWTTSRPAFGRAFIATSACVAAIFWLHCLCLSLVCFIVVLADEQHLAMSVVDCDSFSTAVASECLYLCTGRYVCLYLFFVFVLCIVCLPCWMPHYYPLSWKNHFDFIWLDWNTNSADGL